jgi:hypothetical protein
MVVGPAPISHVAYLHLNIFVNLWPTPVLVSISLVISLCLLLLILFDFLLVTFILLVLFSIIILSDVSSDVNIQVVDVVFLIQLTSVWLL